MHLYDGSTSVCPSYTSSILVCASVWIFNSAHIDYTVHYSSTKFFLDSGSSTHACPKANFDVQQYSSIQIVKIGGPNVGVLRRVSLECLSYLAPHPYFIRFETIKADDDINNNKQSLGPNLTCQVALQRLQPLAVDYMYQFCCCITRATLE